MKGYLIDPENRTITEVDVEDGIDHIYNLIESSTFDCVRLENNDAIYVDDEGLYLKHDYFRVKGFPTPLAGKGLVLGTDNDGYSTDSAYDFYEISELVEFMTYEEALEMARAADRQGRKREAEYAKDGGIGFIYVPIAGILESSRYTEESS